MNGVADGDLPGSKGEEGEGEEDSPEGGVEP